MKRWHIRLDLETPIPDDDLERVRTLLLDTLAGAGFHAKTTTAEWWLVHRKHELPSLTGQPPAQWNGPKGGRL